VADCALALVGCALALVSVAASAMQAVAAPAITLAHTPARLKR
jgi:hypothetical protein